MPDVYRIGGGTRRLTRFKVVTGQGFLFGPAKRPRHALITDGAAHTILAYAAARADAVPWTKPDGPTFDAGGSDLGGGSPNRSIECVMADGLLLSLPPNISSEALSALATPNGGEVIDADRLRRQYGPDHAPEQRDLQELRSAVAHKAERMKQLKQLALAMHAYHDTHRHFPGARPVEQGEDGGSPQLSWRVLLLPFLEQEALYEQFNLAEPWDGPHNLALLSKMPDVFRHPSDSPNATTSRMVLLTGPDALFSKAGPMRLRDFVDGTRNTILIVEAGHDKAVPWTKPLDILFDAANPVACLGQYDTPGFTFVTADGAVRHLKTSVPPRLFRPLVTPSGKEVVSSELQNFGLWR